MNCCFLCVPIDRSDPPISTWVEPLIIKKLAQCSTKAHRGPKTVWQKTFEPNYCQLSLQFRSWFKSEYTMILWLVIQFQISISITFNFSSSFSLDFGIWPKYIYKKIGWLVCSFACLFVRSEFWALWRSSLFVLIKKYLHCNDKAASSTAKSWVTGSLPCSTSCFTCRKNWYRVISSTNRHGSAA